MSLFFRGIVKSSARASRSPHDSIVLRNARIAFAIACAAAVSMIGESRANACGGVIVEPQETETTVVTDHRMAFAISQTRTILWDQIRYQGNPSEFVWALPVKPGTVVELSNDQWIASLDALSQPIIASPFREEGGDGEGGGFGFGCASSAEATPLEESTGGSTPQSVQVVSESVVGPYETVILKSTDPSALENWLTSNGYALPASVAPIVNAYVSEGFDFLAMRLRPGQGIGAMQPVRVISPGADPSLPLRMVQAGVTGNVGITLFVIGEGRYEPQNFPSTTIDDSQITWNDALAQSNYQTLSTTTMAADNGRTFLTEYADQPSVIYDPSFPSGLASLYYGSCDGDVPPGDVSANVNDADGGAANGDGGSVSCADASASDDDGGASEAGPSTSDAGACTPSPASSSSSSGNASANSCSTLDDLVVAVDGMDPNNVWVTRLRANPPVAALAQDLVLMASVPQTPVSNQHTASQEVSGTTASVSPKTRHQTGTFLLAMFTAVLVAMRLRRRNERAIPTSDTRES